MRCEIGFKVDFQQSCGAAGRNSPGHKIPRRHRGTKIDCDAEKMLKFKIIWEE